MWEDDGFALCRPLTPVEGVPTNHVLGLAGLGSELKSGVLYCFLQYIYITIDSDSFSKYLEDKEEYPMHIKTAPSRNLYLWPSRFKPRVSLGLCTQLLQPCASHQSHR